MQLNELLTKYKHLPILEHVLETEDAFVLNLIEIKENKENEKIQYYIEPTKDFCGLTGALSSSIVLNENLQLINMKCGCLESYRQKQCVHTTLLYALALRVLSPTKYNQQLEKYRYTRLALEQEVILNQLASDLRTNSLYFKKIHLTAEITNERNHNYLSLRIGLDKEYVIKGISEFIDLMENKKYYSYGQKLAFVHSYDVLDDESKELYSFLLNICHEESTKSIQIKRSQFLKILEIHNHSGIYYGTETKKSKFYPIVSLTEMNLVLDDASLHMDIPVGTECLISGVNHAYFIGGDQIFVYHFKKRNEALIFNTLFKCDDHALWVGTNETGFISNLLPFLKNEIHIQESFFEKYSLPTVKIVSYFNYQNKCIINNPTIEMDKKYENTPYVLQIIEGYEECLAGFGFEKNEDGSYILANTEQQFAFLTSDVSILKSHGDIYFDESIKKITLKKSSKVQVYISYNVGLIDFKFDSNTLTLEEVQAMMNAYHQKKKYVKLKNDVIIEIKDSDVKELDNFLEDFNLSIQDIKSRTSKPLNYLLKLMGGMSENIHCDEAIIDMIQKIESFSASPDLPIKEFSSILRPYQLDAFKWLTMLASYGFGGILADDMGLGKTLEIISFIASDKVVAPTLIVCPMSLIYNWENECMKWNLKIPVHLIIGGVSERSTKIKQIQSNAKAIYITSYDSLRRDIAFYDTTFRCVVADEAQYIKNQNALKSAAIKQIKAELHFALTGTPIENGLADLWSIFDYIMPGYLSNYNHFKSRYESLIMMQDEETLEVLKKRVQPFILRRTKQHVLKDLPEKLEEIYFCKLEGKQQEIYESFVQKIKSDLDKEGKNILALITRLRQVCITPQLIYEEEIPSAKLALALELITRAISANHRILVFSQFSSVFSILAPMLEDANISYYILDGQTTASKRVELVDNFNQDSRIQVFLISLKAGGTGLNLVGADTVIHLDPWWNISAENQATDRAYRIGQMNNVHVLKLVCKDTIEEKVLLLQHLKNKLADQILLNQNNKITLTKDDILNLID